MSLEKGLDAWGEEERGSLLHKKAKGWWIALVRTEGGRGERGVGQPGRGRIEEEEEEEGGLIWTYDGGSREGGGAR